MACYYQIKIIHNILSEEGGSLLEQIKGKLLVSCQALPNEPLHSSFIMGRMAKAAQEGGAVGIRAQGVEDIREIKKITGLPVIGLIKRNYADSAIYITPTMREVDELLASGCEMIALDMTNRARPNGETMQFLVERIKKENIEVLADISTYEEALQAEKYGVDAVSTTMVGYTDYSHLSVGPDFALIKKLVVDLTIPVLAEGKINTPEDLANVFAAGAYAAIVGSAITRPQLITKKFAAVIQN